jgi:NAD(P)-dependent dehydrogenase (short-subunit alcohol dehydrogenase family)
MSATPAFEAAPREAGGPPSEATLIGKVIVVAGSASPAGNAVVCRLAAGGAHVIAADIRPQTWREENVRPVRVDLLDAAATRAWADGIVAEHGRVDGLIHLVGGWRGGKTFADTDLADWAFLHDLLIRTLQHTTLAFHKTLLESGDARVAIVSQPGAQHPTQGNAVYAAAKAAAEAWTLAMADSFKETGSAATVLVAKALLSDEMRAARPEAKFAGFTHVDDLAETVANLWHQPVNELNGTRRALPA